MGKRIAKKSVEWWQAVLVATVTAVIFFGPSDAEEDKELILEHANMMNRRIENKRVVLYLFDDVVWRRGETVISSNTATYYEDDRWLRLTNEVTVTEPDRIIHSDTLDYFEEGDTAVATGRVTVLSEKGDREMTTTRLIYDRTTDRITALNRPLITITKNNKDEADTSTMHIQGDRLVSVAGDSLFVTGNVTFEGDSLSAECDSSFYDLKNDWIRLRKEPVVYVNAYTVWGDEVDMHTPNDKLEFAVVRGDAIAQGSKELSDESGEEESGKIERYWSSADSLVMTFEEDELRGLSAYSNARSLLEREDTRKKVEKNYVTGESIVVKIQDGKAERVTVEGAGKGVYVMPPDSTGTGNQSVRE